MNIRLCSLLLAVALTFSAKGVLVAAEAQPTSRRFEFTYSATVTGLTPDQLARVWLPIAQTSASQQVEIVNITAPAKHELNEEPLHCNQMIYVAAKADEHGRIPLSVTYHVTRHEVTTALPGSSCDNMQRFLAADKLVPVHGGPAMALLSDRRLPEDELSLARAFYDAVYDHMAYSKEGTGWGRGDVAWACDSRTGNCSDFHSVFISLARSHGLPARFEIGFPLPPDQRQGEISGYHCWAWFYEENSGWIPVDISEADKHPTMKNYYFGSLTADRVAFSTGRDLNLVPRQSGEPVNFFIYPHVEVDGRAYPLDKIERTFTFSNVEG